MNDKDAMQRTVVTDRGTILIRPATEQDAAAYREIRLEALLNHPTAFSADYATALGRPMAFWIERMRSSRAGTGAFNLFAFHDQALIGTCAVFRGDSIKTRHGAV